MKRKVLVLALTVALATTAFVGCGNKETPAPAAQKPATTAPAPTDTKKADVVTTASVVDNGDAFQKAISKDGKWIIATLKDLKIDQNLVLDGDFKNGKKDEKTGEELFQRKIGLYTQDDKHVVTARFTLTAPKITINSLNGSIEHGTFKGDVYVAGKNFKLVDATIEGNLYFLNEDAQKTFKPLDATSKVTGKTELKK